MKKRISVFGIAFLFACVFFGSCDMQTLYEYVFKNESSYYITVTIINNKFRETKDQTDEVFYSSFNFGRDQSKTIYIESENVEFQWDPSSSSYYEKIYVVEQGNKIFFKERQSWEPSY